MAGGCLKHKMGSKTGEKRRFDLSLQQNQHRRELRSAAFDRGRVLNKSAMDILDEEEEKETEVQGNAPERVALQPVKDSRMLQLKLWKEKKEQAQKLAKALQKPVFKAGVVHHSLNPIKELPAPKLPASKRQRAKCSPMKVVQGRKGMATRNMSRKAKDTVSVLAAVPSKTEFKPPKGISAIPLTIPKTPQGMAGRKREIAAATLNALNSNIPVSKMNMVCEMKRAVPFSILASLPTRAVSTPRKKHSILPDPVFDAIEEESDSKSGAGPSVAGPSVRPACYVSPFVTVRRGKRSFHNRQCSSPNLNDPELLTNTASPPKTMTLNSSEPEHNEAYFRNILDLEINRLNALCTKWSDVKSLLPNNVSEDIIGQFDVAICKTQLLIRSKFKQFRGLIVDCEEKTCSPPVLREDLEGFWEMMYSQVVDIDKSFSELAELQQNDWKKTVDAVIPKMVHKKVAKKTVMAKPNTGIRALLLAARKKQLEENKMECLLANKGDQSSEGALTVEMIATPEGSSKRRSLIQQVLLANSAQRARQNSPIVMKVGQISKRMSGVQESEAKTTLNREAGVSSTRTSPLEKVIIQSVNTTDSAPRASEQSNSQLKGSDKENTCANAAEVLKSGVKKHSVKFNECKTPSPQPDKRATRRQTPFRKRQIEDNDCDDEDSIAGTPIATPRRSQRIVKIGSGMRCISLLSFSKDSPSIQPFDSGDLISFDSPRRSERIKINRLC